MQSLGGYSAGNNSFSPYSVYSGLKEVGGAGKGGFFFFFAVIEQVTLWAGMEVLALPGGMFAE